MTVTPKENKNNKFQQRQLWVQIGLLIATTCAFIAAAIYAHIANTQRSVMEETFKEIQKQTASAEKSADAARSAATTSENTFNQNTRFAHSTLEEMRKQSRAMKVAANASKEAAKSSEIQARTSEHNTDIAQQAVRPYVGFRMEMEILEIDKPVTVQVKFLNEGNSPAIVKGKGDIIVNDTETITFDYTGALPFGEAFVLPHKDKPLMITPPKMLTPKQIKMIQQGKIYLFVYGKGSYSGGGGTYPFEFCGLYRSESKQFADCTTLPWKRN